MIPTPTHVPTAEASRDIVLVVHGFGGKRLWMLPLCARLRSRNFRVANWGYPSLLGSVEQHATKLHEHLTGVLAQEARLHIVAHSMGSIVVRSALSIGAIANLRRVVLFAPPNTGTPVARIATSLLGRICKPIADLSDHKESYVNTLPTLDSVDIAVVAARFDVLVPIANTHLPGEREHGERKHIVLNATHNSLLLSPVAANLACSFLRTGVFQQSR